MSIVKKRNEFMIGIFSYIFEEYEYDGENPLMLIENGALLLARLKYDLENDNMKGLEYIDENGEIKRERIKIALYVIYLEDFLRHLGNYGIISFIDIISNTADHYTEMIIDVTIVQDPLIILSFTSHESGAFHIIQEKHNELGQVTLGFNITILHKENGFELVPKTLLSETICCKYDINSDSYSFNNVFNKNIKPYPDLCLDWVLSTCKSYKEDDKLEIWDGKVDTVDAIKMVLSGRDQLVVKPLKIKEEIITDTTQKCTICFDILSAKAFRTKCNHYFHSHCIVRFLTKYYKDLYKSILENKTLTTEYDIDGNVIKGADYEFSCPNCKSGCFKLDCVFDTGIVIIKNPENCIFKCP